MVEVTLKAFVESTWFKGLARVAMIVGTVIGGFVGASFGNLQSRVSGLEDAQIAMSATQQERVKDNEEFQSSVRNQFTNLRAALNVLQSDTDEMKGILTEMQRQDVATIPSVVVEDTLR